MDVKKALEMMREDVVKAKNRMDCAYAEARMAESIYDAYVSELEETEAVEESKAKEMLADLAAARARRNAELN